MTFFHFPKTTCMSRRIIIVRKSKIIPARNRAARINHKFNAVWTVGVEDRSIRKHLTGYIKSPGLPALGSDGYPRLVHDIHLYEYNFPKRVGAYGFEINPPMSIIISV